MKLHLVRFWSSRESEEGAKKTLPSPKIDPWRWLLWFYILLVPVGGTAKELFTKGLPFDDQIKRLGAIAIAIAGIKTNLADIINNDNSL